MMRLPRSLQGRLLVLVLGGVVLLWALAGAAIWVDARHEIDELLDSHLAQSAALLLAQQAAAHDDLDDDPIDARLLHRYASRVAFQVWHDEQLLMRSGGAPKRPLAGHREGFATVRIGRDEWRVFAAQGRRHGIRVLVGEQVASRAEILRAVLHGLFKPVVVALPLLALAVWGAVRHGLRPMRRLSTILAARRPQDLAPVAIAGATSEMAPLLAALNGLFERIGSLLESERRFTADAAHELRTPIAAIRAQAQVALGANAEAERRRALQATLLGCDRATHLVEQLLTLSRLEASDDMATTDVDLGALTRSVSAELAAQALHKQQQLALDASPGCVVRGQQALLAVLVRNLIDNAIRYCPEQARILLQVARRGTAVALTVEDSGPGLNEAQRARLGQRFFRALGSDQSGSGLGWSIVQRVAKAHGAQVTVGRSPALGGLSVEVTWPA